MSRWTKGELTIGEIAQMERKLKDVAMRLELKHVFGYNEKVPAFAIDLRLSLLDMAAVLDLMLKG